ncbi:MAG TPA: response regulator [Polyangiaceae bacterium]|nr:response regulator [Polyangiaceae bacterium]
MTTTLLAVDDSVTMRKVLEITFAGEDYRLLSAESADAALKRASSDRPAVVLVDANLPDQDGYAVCKALKGDNPALGVVLLSSKQGPYDPTRGSSAGVDDFIDKPFDTQQLIEKVRKLVLAKASIAGAAAPAPQPVAPAAPPPPPMRPPMGSGEIRGVAPPIMTRPTAPSIQGASAINRSVASNAAGAALDGRATPQPPPVVQPRQPSAPLLDPGPPPVQPPPPQPPPPAAAPHAAASGVVAIDHHVNERVASLGLTPAQAEAVLALSREIVEKVVWEVVPTLAETLIKEEIRRLTREG